MPEDQVIREEVTELGAIVDQLVDIANTAKKAFVHQRVQLLIQLNNQQDPLCRNIASDMLKMDDLAKRKSGDERESCLRLHSILTHLLIITKTTCHLEETLQKQVKDAVLFSDKAISQVSHIFDKQTEILSSLADVIRSGGEVIRQHALKGCKESGQSCIQFATDHETRLVEGLCFPQSAPLFLAILDQMQTIIHHEREVANLLGTGF
jgi:Na+/phosphate symporter